MNTRTLRLIAFALVAVIAAALKVGSAQAATIPARTALLDRINVVRAEHGLARVYPSTALHYAAQRHSDDMISRDYFQHTSPAGSTVYTRIVNSGFVSGYASWIGGETLAWGTGTLAGAKATVHAWMLSPEHRAILMSSEFRWIGISRACGSFLGHRGACVWTADWVRRG
jgi:uncharacterized protein YkwD